MIEAVVEKTKKNKNRTQYHSFFNPKKLMRKLLRFWNR